MAKKKELERRIKNLEERIELLEKQLKDHVNIHIKWIKNENEELKKRLQRNYTFSVNSSETRSPYDIYCDAKEFAELEKLTSYSRCPGFTPKKGYVEEDDG